MSHLDDQRKQDLVDSLLSSLYETDKEQVRSLVTAGMQRIDDVIVEPSKPNSDSRKRLPRWMSIAIAVTVLAILAIYLPLFDSSRMATAAVGRSIEQAFQDIGRQYHVTLRLQLPDQNDRTCNADLYVKGGQRFAICAYGPIQQRIPVWLGSNPDRSWVIPPVGPVLEGKRQNLNRWAANQEELATPYLHISTALVQMRDNYQLESLPTEDLEVNGRIVTCQRVRGSLNRDSTQSAPTQFELWTDAETGVAIKLRASWSLAEDEFGRESVLIQFQNDKQLADDFFTPSHHGGDARGTISFSEEQP